MHAILKITLVRLGPNRTWFIASGSLCCSRRPPPRDCLPHATSIPMFTSDRMPFPFIRRLLFESLEMEFWLQCILIRVVLIKSYRTFVAYRIFIICYSTYSLKPCYMTLKSFQHGYRASPVNRFMVFAESFSILYAFAFQLFIEIAFWLCKEPL